MAKAYVYTRHGGPETQTFIDREVGEPGPGQLRVAVRAAGVNPVDHKIRTGYTRPGATPAPLPAVLGSEAAGVVERVGPGVEGFRPGDAVFGSVVAGEGGYTELTLMPASVTAHKPEALPFTVAATLPVAAATAYDAVHQLALPPGATLLVTGAGGGVGVAAVQIATALGLRVIGTAGAAKADFVRSLGAEHIPSDADLAPAVRALAPDGVAGVLDLVGGDALIAAATLVTDRTKLLTAADRENIGRLGGSPVIRARTAAVLDAVAALAVEGTLDPHITEILPLGRADEALRLVEEGHIRGKVVIEVPR